MYLITDLVGPCLGIVDVVVFGLQELSDDPVDLLLDHGADVVEDDFFLV
jgi:hypothetical protein